MKRAAWVEPVLVLFVLVIFLLTALDIGMAAYRDMDGGGGSVFLFSAIVSMAGSAPGLIVFLMLKVLEIRKEDRAGRGELRAIVHDFNNVLSSLSGYAEFLIEDLPPGSGGRDFAGKIMDGTAQARTLVRRMVEIGETDA